MASEWRVLLSLEGSAPLSLKFAADTLPDFEAAVAGLSNLSDDAFPLQFHDAEFAEWCELTAHAWCGLPRANPGQKNRRAAHCPPDA